jgi:hypothetical protein
MLDFFYETFKLYNKKPFLKYEENENKDVILLDGDKQQSVPLFEEDVKHIYGNGIFKENQMKKLKFYENIAEFYLKGNKKEYVKAIASLDTFSYKSFMDYFNYKMFNDYLNKEHRLNTEQIEKMLNDFLILPTEFLFFAEKELFYDKKYNFLKNFSESYINGNNRKHLALFKEILNENDMKTIRNRALKMFVASEKKDFEEIKKNIILETIKPLSFYTCSNPIKEKAVNLFAGLYLDNMVNYFVLKDKDSRFIDR